MSSRSDGFQVPESPDLEDPGTIRGDLERGLRFVHAMSMETKLTFERVDAVLRALLDTLVARGTVDPIEIASRVQETSQRSREDNLRDTHVEVDASLDKYAVTDLPDVDCASLKPLCHGRCCKLHFALSFQDLDERVVQWNYERPYRIRQRPEDGYCVHSSTERGCTVYHHRPLTCRRYDCRKDPRIWIDFENRIPAPMSEIEAKPVMLYHIGLKKP
jgi:Putative zinc- or iron-chelating domain